MHGCALCRITRVCSAVAWNTCTKKGCHIALISLVCFCLVLSHVISCFFSYTVKHLLVYLKRQYVMKEECAEGFQDQKNKITRGFFQLWRKFREFFVRKQDLLTCKQSHELLPEYAHPVVCCLGCSWLPSESPFSTIIWSLSSEWQVGR